MGVVRLGLEDPIPSQTNKRKFTTLSQTHGLNCIPHFRPEVKKKDVFYFSTHVITTTVMSSHKQKLPSLGVAGKIP